jgi:hypothetical protein
VAADGRIAFRIRIGVTGHVSLDESHGVRTAVRSEIRRISRLVHSANTETRLAAVSQLAAGADRLIVQEVFVEAEEARQVANLEVVLPADRVRYSVAQGFSPELHEEFERLLERASTTSEPFDVDLSTSEDRATAYEAASRQVIGRCDVLIALWNGRATGGRGGTAETLLEAAARSKPCIWISTEGEPTVRHNLAPGSSHDFYREVERGAAVPPERTVEPKEHPESALAALTDSFARLDQFNRERLPHDYMSRLGQELASSSGIASWAAAPFTRATLLAGRWQSRFRWLSRSISLSAAAAAAALAISLTYSESSIWHWTEAALLVFALAGVFIVRHGRFHERWLSYRVLAERLRSAHYLAPTGADFRRQAQVEAVYVGDRSDDWLMRAFEEVWDRRPEPPRLEGAELEELKVRLAHDWLGCQIQYHKKAFRDHRRRHLALTWAIATLFLATIPFALLHAVGVAEHASTLFTITLPAAGAALGVLVTINQHHALSERSARMVSDLAVIQPTVLEANARTLSHVSSEAARVIAQETGAWFGAMWFLDIEHP